MHAVVLCLIVALGAGAQPLSAQEHRHAPEAGPVFTLAALEEAAQQQNPELMAIAAQAAIVKARRGSAGELADPTASYRNWGVPLSRPWDFNRSQHMFMLERELPGRGKRSLRSQMAEQDVLVTEAIVEAKRRQVISVVRATFFDLVRNEHELRLHREQVELGGQALESARIKYTVGRVPQQDVMKAQVALSRLSEHLIDIERDGRLARARLNTLIGRDPAQAIRVQGEYQPAFTLPNIAELQAMAVEKRPELSAANARIKGSELSIELARKAYTPDLKVAGGYMLMPAGTPGRNAYMLEVGMNLPWLNRKRHDAEIAEATAERLLQETESRAIRAIILQEIQEAYVRADAALRMAKLYSSTLKPQAEATFQSAAAAYQTDKTDFLNLLESQNTYLDVEYDYYKALSEYEMRLAELEQAIGAPLPRSTAAGPEVKP
ncbi:MAG TPA: TolC family protein [Terriglobales bacterium]|nr:TolC family protein [Terriglobales bacterium]